MVLALSRVNTVSVEGGGFVGFHGVEVTKWPLKRLYL
jgi:hypothetical protein